MLYYMEAWPDGLVHLRHGLSWHSLPHFPHLCASNSGGCFMDIASILTLFCIGLSSWWAARHVDAWERDRWLVSLGYTLVSILVLVVVGLINKRLYLFVFLLYGILFFNLERSIKSRYGHIWFSVFVGISGIFPIAAYQLFLQDL